MKKCVNILLCAVVLAAVSVMSGCAPKVAEQKILTMGTNAEFPPFEFVPDDNKGILDKYDGVDVAIALEVAKKMGYTLQISDMPFESLIMALESGKIDFIAAGMTIKPDREESADFSEKYYKAVQYIIVKSDDTAIKSASDLEGKTVGVQQGTTGDYIVTDDIPDTNVKSYTRGIEAVMDLRSGKIDAVVIDSMPATMFYNTYPNDLKIIQDEEFFEDEEYAIAVKKGNRELLKTINEVLNEMKASGEIDKLVTKYSE